VVVGPGVLNGLYRELRCGAFAWWTGGLGLSVMAVYVFPAILRFLVLSFSVNNYYHYFYLIIIIIIITVYSEYELDILKKK